MGEIISTYSLDNLIMPVPYDRELFYDEQISATEKGIEPAKAVGVFATLIFTEGKELILQKRSNKKRHNPYLIDKTVGGHIQYGDSPYYTAMIETVQELRVPSVVLRKEENFERTLGLLKKSLESTAVLTLAYQDVLTLDHFIDGKRIPIVKNIWLFFGIYSGPMKPIDREASGVLYYDLPALEEEMKRMPDLFTPDLHFFMQRFKPEITEFLKILK